MLRVYDGERINVLGLSSTFKSEWIRYSFPFRDFLIFPYCLIMIIRHGSRSRSAGYYLDTRFECSACICCFKPSSSSGWSRDPPQLLGRPGLIKSTGGNRVDKCDSACNFTACGDSQTHSVVTSKPPVCNCSFVWGRLHQLSPTISLSHCRQICAGMKMKHNYTSLLIFWLTAHCYNCWNMELAWARWLFWSSFPLWSRVLFPHFFLNAVSSDRVPTD